MTKLSEGARHYVLMLFPRLIKDIEELGLAKIIRTSGFTEQEVTQFYFDFVSINRVLPDDPDKVSPDLWEHLVTCIQVLSAMVSAASLEGLVEARERAVRKFLPQARRALESEYRVQKEEGPVDFRLAQLLRGQASPERSRALCMEAIRRERELRVASVHRLSTAGLTPHQVRIVTDARNYVLREMADPPAEFAVLDLLIRLLDLLYAAQLLEGGSGKGGDAIPAHLSVDRIIFGIGNMLYRHELGLDVSVVNVANG